MTEAIRSAKRLSTSYHNTRGGFVANVVEYAASRAELAEVKRYWLETGELTREMLADPDWEITKGFKRVVWVCPHVHRARPDARECAISWLEDHLEGGN